MQNDAAQRVNLEDLYRVVRNHKKDSSDRYSLSYFETRLERVQDIWKRCVATHPLVYNDKQHSSPLLDEYKRVFEEAENTYFDIVSKCKEHINEYKCSATAAAATTAPQQITVQSSEIGIKLERIKIPRFDGQYLKWTSFHELFTAMVHDDKRLLPVQKMQYLKSLLDGEANNLIKHLPASEDNYLAAWELLTNRFENKRIIIGAHLNAITSVSATRADNSNSYKRLLDVTTESLAGINGLGHSTESWSPILIHLLCQKLDIETRRKWEESLGTAKDVPTWEQFKAFLELRFRSTEIIDSGKTPNKILSHTTNINEKLCVVCKKNHRLAKCENFVKYNVNKRREVIAKYRLCFNCLRSGHNVKDCYSSSRCLKCNKAHHTMLHADEATKRSEVTSAISAEDRHDSVLATAMVYVQDKFGEYVPLRALIDQGSQRSFISESALQVLKLPRKYNKTIINGIGSSQVSVSKGIVGLTVREKWSKKRIHISALIISRITGDLPYADLPIRATNIHPNDLADPSFHISGKIDLLLGADVFCTIIQEGVKPAQIGSLAAQKTSLGWILSGRFTPKTKQSNITSLVSIEDLDCTLRKFWEQEEMPAKRELSSDDSLAEEIYKRDFKRLVTGRYEVSLPFERQPTDELNGSRSRAEKRFLQLERRFKSNTQLHEDYVHIIREYFLLEQIEEIPQCNLSNTSYYLPHHAVIKDSSTTKKTRVVFDASAKAPSGKSLNDLLLTGPTIQNSLYNILMRWRKYEFALTGDIEKMYRQIWVRPEDRDFQRIVWREHSSEELKDYRLKTVTFGVSSAPFVAVRTLHQIALSVQSKNPHVAEIIRRDFYVDDLITGAHDLPRAHQIQSEVREILQSSGFTLRKWASNNESLLSSIAAEDSVLNFTFASDSVEEIKTLGLCWTPSKDYFSFALTLPVNEEIAYTKRIVLSEISRLFDPLGWLQPILILGKILIQQLWLTQLTWDCLLPKAVKNEWLSLRNDLKFIENIRIPRWIRYAPNDLVQLHGFADASSSAYAAVVYVRIQKPDGQIFTHLLSSKAKVAPIKTVSIPRLELCGAQLAVQLMYQIQETFEWSDVNCHFWTDSTVVLAWLSQHPNKWKTYVANRVSYILSNSTRSQWAYVNTKQNPADIASRGTRAELLQTNELWWKGPLWLNLPQDQWPQPTIELPVTGPELRITSYHVTHISEPDWLQRYSSFDRMIRITAYCLRFKYNTLNPNKRQTSFLMRYELNRAAICCLRLMQGHFYNEEIKALNRKQLIKGNSSIKTLNPFLDSTGCLRVGGRIAEAPVSYDQRHPVIINGHSNIAKLIAKLYHRQLLHAGLQTTLATIRLKYWITGGHNLIKRTIHECLICYRNHPVSQNQIMGILPKVRVTPARPFASVGLDFGGPFNIKYNNGRGAKTCKAYIALFVCLVTKAIHLELVSDLTSDACLAAIRRFIARRGLCSDIYSDQGTNFIGANNSLKQEYLNSMRKTQGKLAAEKITWHFIPPGSPHFGGLWEAGIKATKARLRKVVGDQKLTYEEMATVLTQIESCLNSRPLYPCSNDVNDLEAITPGHFLIGQHLQAAPDVTVSKKGKWELLQQLKNSFWERWSRQYMTSLQERCKWVQPQKNLEPNQLVLIKDERVPANKWPLGRIIETHPGNDGLVRVATIKTAKGVIQRNITKICPIHSEPSTQTTVEDPTDHQNNLTRRPTSARQGQKKSGLNSLLLILYLLSLCTVAFAKNINVTQFTDRPGIYFEDRGKMHLVHSDWKMLVYFDLNSYWQELEGIGSGIASLNKTCYNYNTQNSSFCHTHVTQLVRQYKRLQQANEILMQNRHSPQRQRRGALNFIGNVANALFGVLDQEDAKKYDAQISAAKENDQHIYSLLKNQTSIIEATTKLMKRQRSDIENQFNHLEGQLNAIHASELKEITTLSVTLHYSMIMEDFREVQEELLQLFLNARQQKNYLILTPTELIQQARMVSQNMPTGAQLPTSIESSQFLHDMFNVMRSNVAILKDRLIIELRVPLKEAEVYTIYRLIPLPTIHQGEHIMIHAEIENLVITSDRMHYFSITHDGLSRCQHLSSSRLCRSSSPIYGLESHNYRCEVTLLSQHRDYQKDCKFRIVPPTNTWIPLSEDGQYIFSLTSPQVTTVDCDDGLQRVTLREEGIISLSPGCSLKHPTVSLAARSSIQTVVKTQLDVMPAINITHLWNNTFDFNLNNIRSTFNKEIITIEQALDLQQKDLTSRTMSTMIFKQEDYDIILLLLIIGFVLIVLGILWKPVLPNCSFTARPRYAADADQPLSNLRRFRQSIRWPKVNEEPPETSNVEQSAV